MSVKKDGVKIKGRRRYAQPRARAMTGRVFDPSIKLDRVKPGTIASAIGTSGLWADYEGASARKPVGESVPYGPGEREKIMLEIAKRDRLDRAIDTAVAEFATSHPSASA